MSTGTGLAGSHDERRLFEHFVIAGLAENQAPERLTPSSGECGLRNTRPLAPITDIAVIFPSFGEKPPDGFEVIESTTLGYPADLNHGSIGQKSVFLCYKRGYNKLPLVDIGILDEGCGDKPTIDSNVVQTTPFGRCANVNNASQGIYLTYRRAPPKTSQSQFVVTDIKVILANKGEIPPHTYYKISRNLNKGLVGSEVFICYKKSQGSAKRLAYKPSVLDYFPRTDHSEEMEDFKLAQNVAMFCLPMGALIECWPTEYAAPDRSFSTFVLTDENGTKFYGSAVTFYEKYNKSLSDDQLENLDLKSDEGGTVEDSGSNNDPADDIVFYKNVSICLISRFPFFNSFKRFLFFLHRMSSKPSSSHSVPIERYISHLMYEVSFPTPRRPRVFMQLGAENISFDSHDDSQLPLNGAQLIDTLKYLGSDNLMYLMLLALLEQKILIHSLRPWMLAAVAESMCALMFPFHWQCPYIPQCPLGLAGVLHAPLPFIAGVDSRYFELYEDPPDDVTCFDLDTSAISCSSVRASFKTSMLPKKPAKQLKLELDEIVKKLRKQDYSENSKTDGGFIPVDQDLVKQRRRREFENEIHDAFLKFIASIMRGYQAFLRPIKSAPMNENATDTGNLFDLDGFLKSRDRASADFYKRFSETQSFMRFIEERSFVSDKNMYNAFFDDCISKLTSAIEEGRDVSSVQLLEPDTSHNHTTVFIPAPEPFINQETGEEMQFVYREFPTKMKSENFQLDRIQKSGIDGEKVPMHFEASRCSAVRTKPETRSSLLAATNAVKTNPLHWSKTLLFYSYSLWFMQLESLLLAAPNKKKILRLAFNVLDRMEKTEIFPLDQVCYRVLIELCGKYNEPEMAVKVMRAMQRAGLEQNAVTYGIYHRAVMDATWPSPARQKAIKMWNLLRIVVSGAETLRKWANVDRRALRPEDVEKASEPSRRNSRNSDKITEITASYHITSYPLDDEETAKPQPCLSDEIIDPLGAIGLENSVDSVDGAEEVKLASTADTSMTATREQRSKSLGKVGMSPSRAKFFADHATLPFSNENSPKSDKKEPKSGWLKGIANSPMFKMIKSTTFDASPKQTSAESSGASPSFHSVVNRFKKGYHDVMPPKFRLGVSTLLNKSVGAMGSGIIYSDEKYSNENPFLVNPKDPAYVLDSGVPCCLLKEEYWMREVYLQLKRRRERMEKSQKSEENAEIPSENETRTAEKVSDDSTSKNSVNFGPFSPNIPGKLEVILCTATYCPSCRTMVYDEEIMAGWKVDDQNLNTVCPHCSRTGTATDAVSTEAENQGSIFAPRLKIRMRWIEEMKTSWYHPGGLQESRNTTPEKSKQPPQETCLEVAFVSPLVLRRELETILSNDKDAMKNESIKSTHPIAFWNLIYYLRRLSLPSHLFSWIAEKHHIRCVFDLPTQHDEHKVPLYFYNPNHDGNRIFGEFNRKIKRSPEDGRESSGYSSWKIVTDSVNNNLLFKAIQTLVNSSRVVKNGTVHLGAHFPIFRDIQFASIDVFGRALLRDALDTQYDTESNKLPPKIQDILPMHDHPLSHVTRACRKVFMPLDLF